MEFYDLLKQKNSVIGNRRMVAMEETAKSAVIAGLIFNLAAVGIFFLILAVLSIRVIAVAGTGVVRGQLFV